MFNINFSFQNYDYSALIKNVESNDNQISQPASVSQHIKEKESLSFFLLDEEEEKLLLESIGKGSQSKISVPEESMHHTSKKIKKVKEWKGKHDGLLQIAISNLGTTDWKNISKIYFTNRRDANQCRERYHILLDRGEIELIPFIEAPKYSPSSEILSARIRIGEQIGSIKKNYQESSSDELKRLRKWDILSSSVEKKLDRMIAKVSKEDLASHKGEFLSNPFDQIKVLLGRALEVKNLCSDTHYVFTHAQDTDFIISSYLIKALSKFFDPGRDVHSFKFFRSPHKNLFSIDDLMSLLSFTTDREWLIRKELLSVDAYFFNSERGESTIDFLYHNSTLLHLDKHDPFKKIYGEIIKDFVPNAPILAIAQLVHELMRMTHSFENKDCGNLFAICIPKEMVVQTNCLFRAHPYGNPCSCHPQETNLAILNNLQKNILDESTKCQNNKNVVPQYRLNIFQLKPENGVMIFSFNTLSSKEKKDLKHAINLLVLKIYAIHHANKRGI